ncbi:tail fiber protein [Oceanidesulfovibrio marinus]|nr:tail fiber protein [Oceanidesulfovibrio marinus]
MGQDIPLLSNFSEYSLAAGVAVGATTIILESTAGLPVINTEYEYIPMVIRDATTNREIIHVTAVNTDTNELTVVRGCEGTTAQEWSASAYIYVTLTAEAASDLQAYAAALAEDWAVEDEDVEVQPGQYSAKHHALKAAASASAASLSEANASASEDKAQEWAENPEDSEVEAGQYSAKHYALKAAASAAAAQAAASTFVGVPVGTTLDSRGDTVDEGFLPENSAAVSRTTFANLFAKIGTKYGAGDGSTTFNLPDSRNYFKRGWDGTPESVGAVEADAFKAHSHSASIGYSGSHTHSGTTTGAGSHAHTYYRWVQWPTPGASSGGTSSTYNGILHDTSWAGDHSHSLSINSSGNHNHSVTVNSTGDVETRPMNMRCLSQIKY